jgi:hypothetical protein
VAWEDDPVSVMLTCGDAYGLIVRTIDDARLSGGERAALRRHLASCPRCRDEYETQHDVRRLLVLHIQDGVPTGFAERLNARLDDVGHRDTYDTRRRAWAPRLIPLAAAMVLMVAGPSVRDAGKPDAAPGARPASSRSSGTAVGKPRTVTTIELPSELQIEHQPRDRPSRRHGPPPVSSEDVARAPAPAWARPPVGDSDADETEVAIAAGVSGTPIESESKIGKEAPATNGAGGDSASAFEPREPRRQQRDRVANASERPAILPRPPAPFPNARPAMPAPPAVLPDRSIPPW